MSTVPSPKFDISTKRQLLFSVRMRFSPQTQPVLETAINKIIEQNLVLAGAEGLGIAEMQQPGALSFINEIPAISGRELQKALARLEQQGRVVRNSDGRFRLSQAIAQEIWSSVDEAENRLRRVLKNLFRNFDLPISDFAQPFLHCLCLIFSRLGEAYVRNLKGDITAEELIKLSSVERALRHTVQQFPFLEKERFGGAVYRFFRESDPLFAAVKWNMAQNYYVAKALGLDQTGRLLSRELFADGEFYLDTNVLTEALEPSTKHYKSFQAMSKACNGLNIRLKTCQISIDELRRVVSFERDNISKVLENIPDETADKVRGILLPIYRERLRSGEQADLNEIVKMFDEAMPFLESQYGIERIDDKWFDDAISSSDTKALVEELQRIYAERRGREKTKNAALHDALVLRWIDKERKTLLRTWFITRDLSLLEYGKGTTVPDHAFAITMNALLQWLSPMALSDSNEDDMTEVFADAIKHHLLPQDSFFELTDFLIFAEMEWATKELPSEDVENCIRTIRRATPALDPSNSVDRERLSHEIGKFFADPGRKYKQELELREAQLSSQSSELEQKQHEAELLQSALESERAARVVDNETWESKRKTDRLRRSGWWLLALITLLLVGIEAGVVYLTYKFGEGSNLWQKLLGSWHLLLGVLVGGYTLLGWFLVGRDRLRVLGWPFDRWFKAE